MYFYQLEAQDAKQVHMTYDGNVILGNDLYGGMLGICKLGNTLKTAVRFFLQDYK